MPLFHLHHILRKGISRLKKGKYKAEFYQAEPDARLAFKLKSISSILLIIVILSALFWPKENTVSIFSETEKVIIKPSDSILTEWDISEAKVFLDPLNPEIFIQLSSDDAKLVPGSMSSIEVRKHANGDLNLTVTSTIDSPTTIARASGEDITLNRWASIHLAQSKIWPRTFPFRGNLIVGDDVAPDVNYLMKSGKIQIIERQILGTNRFIAAENTLDSGDRIILNDLSTNTQAILNGFLRVDKESVLTLVGHGSNINASIERLGSAGYEVKPSPWSRLVTDPFLIVITIILSTFLLSIELSSIIIGVFYTERKLSKSTPHSAAKPKKNNDSL